MVILCRMGNYKLKCKLVWAVNAPPQHGTRLQKKWELTATGLYVFKSEIVDFEGTFGGYLYNYLFVRHVEMVASACLRSHPASLEVMESMLWLDHALTVKIQKNNICWDIAHIRRRSSCIDTPRRYLRS